MSENGTPIRRLRWYHLVTPQAVGLGAPMLLLAGVMLVWAVSGRLEGFAAQLQMLLTGFTGLNLLLDFSNLLILGMALWIVSRVTDPMLPARFAPSSVCLIVFVPRSIIPLVLETTSWGRTSAIHTNRVPPASLLHSREPLRAGMGIHTLEYQPDGIRGREG